MLSYKSLPVLGVFPDRPAFYERWAAHWVEQVRALDSIGVLDSTLPRSLTPTLYEHVRDTAFLIISLSLLALAAIFTLSGGRHRSSV